MILALKKSAILIITFILIGLMIVTSKNTLTSFNVDALLLMYANIFFMTLSLVSLFFQLKAMSHKNPNVFIRSVMGSMLVKMLITAAAVLVYVQLSGQHFNKRGVFISLFIYLVYLFAEVMTLLKKNKKIND